MTINTEDGTTSDLKHAKTWTSRAAARADVSKTFRWSIVQAAPHVWAVKSTHWTGTEVVDGYWTEGNELLATHREREAAKLAG